MALIKDSIAIITARGGSMRVPRKNCRLFRGRPMVAWPTGVAVSSGLFARVIISTDDDEIAEAAITAGAEWPFRRPPELADSFSGTTDVLLHDLKELSEKDELPEYCCCLYGTSAMIKPETLRRAKKRLDDGFDLAMAVIKYTQPIERALRMDESGILHYRQPEYVALRTQDIKPSFYDAGQFYFFNIKAFLEGGAAFINLNKTGIIMSPLDVVDIDTEEDWNIAEKIAILNDLNGW